MAPGGEHSRRPCPKSRAKNYVDIRIYNFGLMRHVKRASFRASLCGRPHIGEWPGSPIFFCRPTGTKFPIIGQHIVSLGGRDRRQTCTLATWCIRKLLTILSVPFSICIPTPLKSPYSIYSGINGEADLMATVTNRADYWEKARESGFDLSWLDQLKQNTMGETTSEFSENNTGRV